MGSLFKSPKPPAPINVGAVTEQANAQNRQNAEENAKLNRLNQVDQYGNRLTFGPDGTVSQQLGDVGQQFAGGLGALGMKYFDTAGQGAPDSQGAFDRAYELASANLEPRFQRQKDAEINRLRNQGLDPTSEAYKSQISDVNLAQNEARNNLVTNLQGQMFNQDLQTRQQQLAEIAPGLNFGIGSLTPQYAAVPQVGQQNVDIAGLNMANQQQAMANYNAQMQQRNAMLGGLGSIFGTGARLLTGGIF